MRNQACRPSNQTGSDKSLGQVFLLREFQAGGQYFLPGRCPHDDPLASAAVGGFDHEAAAERRDVAFADDRLADERRQQDGEGGVEPGMDQLHVHGGLVFRPLGKVLRVDEADEVFLSPALEGLKAAVSLRAVEQRAQGHFPFVQGGRRLEQVLRRDRKEGERSFFAGLRDHLHKIGIVFPVPGQAEVVMRHALIIEAGG